MKGYGTSCDCAGVSVFSVLKVQTDVLKYDRGQMCLTVEDNVQL